MGARPSAFRSSEEDRRGGCSKSGGGACEAGSKEMGRQAERAGEEAQLHMCKTTQDRGGLGACKKSPRRDRDRGIRASSRVGSQRAEIGAAQERVGGKPLPCKTTWPLGRAPGEVRSCALIPCTCVACLSSAFLFAVNLVRSTLQVAALELWEPS